MLHWSKCSLSSRHHWLESFFPAAVVGSHSILVLQTPENVRQYSPKAPKLNMPCTTGPAPRHPADPKRDSALRCRGRRPSNYQSVRHLFRVLRVMAISTLSRRSRFSMKTLLNNCIRIASSVAL